MYKNNMVNMGAETKNITFCIDKLYKKCKLIYI